jgi:hypothetical protein
MTSELNEEILRCMKLYYLNRADQANKPWNKQEDLSRLFVATRADGWSTEASCGTFWLQKVVDGKIICFKVTEDNIKYGGNRVIREGTEIESELKRELTEALSKCGKKPAFYTCKGSDVK